MASFKDIKINELSYKTPRSNETWDHLSQLKSGSLELNLSGLKVYSDGVYTKNNLKSFLKKELMN